VNDVTRTQATQLDLGIGDAFVLSGWIHSRSPSHASGIKYDARPANY